MRNGEFSKPTIVTLYKRAGEHCSRCKRLTSIPHSNPEKYHNMGEAAHINGIKAGENLRNDPTKSFAELSNARNGIWLCQTCHHLIDNDADTYTVEVLTALKSNHEILVRKVFDTGSGLMPTLDEHLKKIKLLKELILAKEQLINAKDILYNDELSHLRFHLQGMESEKSFLQHQLEKIKSQIIDLDNSELKEALLDERNVDKALSILNEDKLSENENVIAKSRLLRARLLISKGEFQSAAINFEKAVQLCPEYSIAFEFIQFLYYRQLDYEKIIQVCEMSLAHGQDHPVLTAELMGHLAQANLKLDRPDYALKALIKGLTILEENITDNAGRLIQIAKFEKHIGDSYKLLGRLEIALQYYERALNRYFQIFLRNQESGTTEELAGLATAIGLLYEANNNDQEALVHHLRAKEIMKDDDDNKNTRALIFLNLATCYLKKKNFNMPEAKKHIKAAIKILNRLSRQDPMENLEYLAGAKCMLGDVCQFDHPRVAEKSYKESLRLGQILFGTNPIFEKVISHTQHNYAVFLLAVKQDFKTGFELLNDSIDRIRKSHLKKFEFVSCLCQALLFKINFVQPIKEKKEILNEIIEITSDTAQSDRNMIYRIMAEKGLASFNS